MLSIVRLTSTSLRRSLSPSIASLSSSRSSFSLSSSLCSSSSSSSSSSSFSSPSHLIGSFSSSFSFFFSTYARSTLPTIRNEPMAAYAPGSTERSQLQSAIDSLLSQSTPLDIPCIVGGKEIRTGLVGKQVMPSDHARTVATFHEANEQVVKEAIASSLKAKKQWEELPWESRAAIFLKAADLLTCKYKYQVLASVIVGQGKNAWQAEIDASAEAADFWRFNSKYLEQIYSTQPAEHAAGNWNRVEYRPLEGFVVAITPFNFAAIGSNLPSAPALMGNAVIWKPSSTAILSNYWLFKILKEAGLPDGVINFLPGDGLVLGREAFQHRDFAGLHFTGSTAVFQTIWQQISSNLKRFRSYPRLVGETGGKNFHFVHESADIKNVVNQTIRAAFEYSGQKCSACSRLYIPSSIWPTVEKDLVSATQQIIQHHFGQSTDFNTFVSAVIDDKSFGRLEKALNRIKQDAQQSPSTTKILVGGNCDSSKGYFVQPTIVLTTDPNYFALKDEFFGPILTVYVYNPQEYQQTLELCDATAQYALTGALFANDRYALDAGAKALINSAGNFYVNDKSTGAVVGQQPFGGGRGSGTNDKAGAINNLWRWVSSRSIKENFVPLYNYQYPHMKKQ